MLSLSMMLLSEWCVPDGTFDKHHIIAGETSNIIFAKQMYHIAPDDASLIRHIQ